ncbi:MAG: (2Fe-2S)-binding protein [Mycobacterium sp.]
MKSPSGWLPLRSNWVSRRVCCLRRSERPAVSTRCRCSVPTRCPGGPLETLSAVRRATHRLGGRADTGTRGRTDQRFSAPRRSGATERHTGPPAVATAATYTQGRFVRRSCCLFYQAPRAGLCGDCVLGSAPDAWP